MAFPLCRLGIEMPLRVRVWSRVGGKARCFQKAAYMKIQHGLTSFCSVTGNKMAFMV
jgi:uncharacterized protein (DUF302 family)